MRPFAKYIGEQEEIKTVVEIGVGAFVNAMDLLQGCDRLIGVDQYVWYPEGDPYSGDANNLSSQAEQDERYIAGCQLMIDIPKFQLIRLPSLEAAALFDDPVDAVYIDANHGYEHVRDDIYAWMGKCQLIGGHDYGDPKNPGVQQAVDEIFLQQHVVLLDDGEWMVWLD